MRTTILMGYIALSLLFALVVGSGAFAEPAKPAVSTNVRLVNLEIKDVSVRDAIGKIFEGTGLKYTIMPGVSGRVVELKLKGVTFEQALDAMMEAARLTYTIEDGAYVISAAKAATASVSAAAGSGGAQPPSAQPRAQSPPVEQPNATEAQASETGSRNAGVGPVIIHNEQHGPVFYGQSGFGQAYPSYDLWGYPRMYRFGQVGIVGGWPSVAIAGGVPYVLRRTPLPPPPLGYVSPEVQRFLQTQWAIRNWTYITPY
jgi:hypothetical protein